MLFLNLIPLLAPAGQANVHVYLSNEHVTVSLDRSTGRYDVTWTNGFAIHDAFGETKLPDGKTVRTSDYTSHETEIGKVRDLFGSGTRLVIHHRAADKPELRQTFWIYGDRNEAMTCLELVSASGTGTNYIAPVVSGNTVNVPHQAPIQALFVPWDNDNYFRFRSDGWGEGEGDGDGSYEVSAAYDDSTRQGLIIGSVDHDTWKTAVRFTRDKANGTVSSVRAFSGVTSKYTHDSQPHGTVTGNVVSSPRLVLGAYDDWRAGMERYANLNATVKPALKWAGGHVPFAWNSWSGHKQKVNAREARIATDFIHDQLPNFRSGGIAFINFDAGSGNLTPTQMDAFIAHAHELGLRTGIYWTPFACWGKLESKVEGTNYTYGDIILRDAKGQPLPKLDGSYPLDPSHPGTLAMIDAHMKSIVAKGFDYVKLDFISHGALEGVHHDPKIQTGIQAYNMGMQRIVDDLSPKRIGRPFFISLSIAPMFPHGYAHSRRISCDIFANIGASEYLLNSTNYGWWPGDKRLYYFNDPDSATVWRALGEDSTTEQEARTRYTASVISGGMMIQGDDLTDPEAVKRVLQFYRNEEVNALARKTPPFWPVTGTTNYAAGDAFVFHDGKATYVAVFNFDKKNDKHMDIPFDRLNLKAGNYNVHELWRGQNSSATGSLPFDLAPMDCSLVRLTAK